MATDLRQDETLFAALGYLPPLFLLPILARGDSDFARFHGVQSLVLLLGLAVFQLLVVAVDLLFGRLLGSTLVIGPVFRLVAWIFHYPVGLAVGFAYLVFLVLGASQAATGRRWRIPVLGAFVDRMSVSFVGAKTRGGSNAGRSE